MLPVALELGITLTCVRQDAVELRTDQPSADRWRYVQAVEQELALVVRTDADAFVKRLGSDARAFVSAASDGARELYNDR